MRRGVLAHSTSPATRRSRCIVTDNHGHHRNHSCSQQERNRPRSYVSWGSTSWHWHKYLLQFVNSYLAAAAAALSEVKIRPTAAGYVLLSAFLPVCAWATFAGLGKAGMQKIRS